jgi:hypothetical protein
MENDDDDENDDDMLGPYTTHATPILIFCAPYKSTTIIVVPLH